MELTGRLKEMMDAQTFPSGSSKREFVITTEEQYPQDIVFELWKDKISLLSNFNINDRIKVTFDIRGRQNNGRYFLNLAAWRIENAGAAQAAAPSSYQAAPTPPMPQPAPMPESFNGSVDDDLPF
ncbi:MAG: DUF3127 domain-containing protein [Flavobacteriales bacterium]|jgi:single-strand DNA-binding protein|nr:DUF3127 domain-containing protein [Flavobacteriales bacterium]